jgi:hypothetical protein
MPHWINDPYNEDSGPGSSVVITTELRAGRSRVRIPVEAEFSAPVHTGPGAHPASCTMGTGSFPGVKSVWGVTLTPHPLLVPWSWIELYLHSPYVLYGLYRASVSVQGCTLPLPLLYNEDSVFSYMQEMKIKIFFRWTACFWELKRAVRAGSSSRWTCRCNVTTPLWSLESYVCYAKTLTQCRTCVTSVWNEWLVHRGAVAYESPHTLS